MEWDVTLPSPDCPHNSGHEIAYDHRRELSAPILHQPSAVLMSLQVPILPLLRKGHRCE